MKRFLGAGFLVVLALAWWYTSGAEGQRGPYRTLSEGGSLVALPPVVHKQVQQVVVLDPRSRVLAVYHIDLDSGGIQLKAVRQIGWDLQLENFNGAKPLPREVRTLVQPPGGAASVPVPVRGN